MAYISKIDGKLLKDIEARKELENLKKPKHYSDNIIAGFSAEELTKGYKIPEDGIFSIMTNTSDGVIGLDVLLADENYDNVITYCTIYPHNGFAGFNSIPVFKNQILMILEKGENDFRYGEFKPYKY